MQSYNAIMSGNCIGDTLYCTGNQLENPEDSEKKANEAKWQNNSDCGPEKKIIQQVTSSVLLSLRANQM